jgi:hypothetical protein
MNPNLYNQAKTMFTPEQMEELKHLGNQVYDGGVDFTTSKIINNPELLLESTAYIIEALKSGLNINDLSEIEINVLKESYGKKWKKRVKDILK